MRWLKNLDMPLYRSGGVVSVWHVCEGGCLRKEEAKLSVKNSSTGASRGKVRGRVRASSLSPRLCSYLQGLCKGVQEPSSLTQSLPGCCTGPLPLCPWQRASQSLPSSSDPPERSSSPQGCWARDREAGPSRTRCVSPQKSGVNRQAWFPAHPAPFHHVSIYERGSTIYKRCEVDPFINRSEPWSPCKMFASLPRAGVLNLPKAVTS